MFVPGDLSNFSQKWQHNIQGAYSSHTVLSCGSQLSLLAASWPSRRGNLWGRGSVLLGAKESLGSHQKLPQEDRKAAGKQCFDNSKVLW